MDTVFSILQSLEMVLAAIAGMIIALGTIWKITGKRWVRKFSKWLDEKNKKLIVDARGEIESKVTDEIGKVIATIKDLKEDLDKHKQWDKERLDAIRSSQMVSIGDKVSYIGGCLLKQKDEITQAEWDNFRKLHKAYIILGGNGDYDALCQKVERRFIKGK